MYNLLILFFAIKIWVTAQKKWNCRCFDKSRVKELQIFAVRTKLSVLIFVFFSTFECQNPEMNGMEWFKKFFCINFNYKYGLFFPEGFCSSNYAIILVFHPYHVAVMVTGIGSEEQGLYS